MPDDARPRLEDTGAVGPIPQMHVALWGAALVPFPILKPVVPRIGPWYLSWHAALAAPSGPKVPLRRRLHAPLATAALRIAREVSIRPHALGPWPKLLHQRRHRPYFLGDDKFGLVQLQGRRHRRIEADGPRVKPPRPNIALAKVRQRVPAHHADVAAQHHGMGNATRQLLLPDGLIPQGLLTFGQEFAPFTIGRVAGDDFDGGAGIGGLAGFALHQVPQDVELKRR